MAEDPRSEGYMQFLTAQAEKYENMSKELIRDALRYHERTCESPSFLKPICGAKFIEAYMDHLHEVVIDRQQNPYKRKKSNHTTPIEEAITEIFGPPFDPRAN